MKQQMLEAQVKDLEHQIATLKVMNDQLIVENEDLHNRLIDATTALTHMSSYAQEALMAVRTPMVELVQMP